jgi:mannosylglycoprotein endo-beta-mannosidase
LKINFQKSEVIVMGAVEEEQARVARLLNCKQGKFTFTYLGFTMLDKKLTIADMEPLVATVGKRAAPWQGRFMSSAARLILINTCLSNLPTHNMGLFLFADGVHAGFDKHRSKFFWEGQGAKKKYHLVKWAEVCKPKDQGGLGVLNTKEMNKTLMAKWIWRLLDERNGDLLWVRLLKVKYRVQELFSSSPAVCSPFWHSIQRIKDAFKLGAKFSPGRNSKLSFWKDLWVGDSPLCLIFPDLFDKCSAPDLPICHAFTEDGWNI